MVFAGEEMASERWLSEKYCGDGWRWLGQQWSIVQWWCELWATAKGLEIWDLGEKQELIFPEAVKIEEQNRTPKSYFYFL